MPHTLAAQIGQLIDLSVVLFGFWKGGRTERLGAVILGLQLSASEFTNHRHGVAPEYGILIVDIVTFVLLTMLAFTSNRRWTLFATAFQLLAVLTHCARMLDATLNRWAYMTTTILWGYAVLAALAFGAAQHMAKAKRTISFHAENEAHS